MPASCPTHSLTAEDHCEALTEAREMLAEIQDQRRHEIGLRKKLEASNARMRELLREAVPLAAFAQESTRYEARAQQWHHDVAVVLSTESEGTDRG